MKTRFVSFKHNYLDKLKLKINLDDPGIDQRDPRFIGAWWLGFIVIGLLLLVSTLPLFLFPQQFKGATVKTEEIRNNLKGVKGGF